MRILYFKQYRFVTSFASVCHKWLYFCLHSCCLTAYYMLNSCHYQYLFTYKIYNYCNIWSNQHRSHGSILEKVIRKLQKHIHETTDYFMRLEGGSRGSVHMCWFAYIRGEQQYVEVYNETVVRFYDKIKSCSS